MFSKIVVPLDGSSLAEQALTTAIHLAKALNARLLLLQSFELKEIAGQLVSSELELKKSAEAYLKHVLMAISDPALSCNIPTERVDILVEYGPAEDEIAVIAPFEGADLIVMATHSRAGLLGLLKGSIANRVLQLATVPVILIHPVPENENQP